MLKLFWLGLSLLALNVNATTVITFATGDATPKEDNYEYHLLRLALDATQAEYGDYLIKDLPKGEVPTFSRLRVYAEDNQFENFVYKDSASNDIVKVLQAVPFPVDLGVTGYRIGFVSPESKKKVAAVQSLDDLKKISIIQGRGWLDGEILKRLGFSVVEGGNIKGLFYMAANNRADLFLIGSNELEREWRNHQDVKYLNYDEAICIYYPLPKFFFLNKSNAKLARRIEQGLKIAYENGSVRSLWEKYYGEAMAFAALKNRKIFKFENPLIDSVDKSYQQYIVNPELL